MRYRYIKIATNNPPKDFRIKLKIMICKLYFSKKKNILHYISYINLFLLFFFFVTVVVVFVDIVISINF